MDHKAEDGTRREWPMCRSREWIHCSLVEGIVARKKVMQSMEAVEEVVVACDIRCLGDR